jgi:uncharacterized OB-fold protein
MATAMGIKCCSCGAESAERTAVCELCGSSKLIDRNRYTQLWLVVSILIVAVLMLVVAMVAGELHRAAIAMAVGS